MEPQTDGGTGSTNPRDYPPNTPGTCYWTNLSGMDTHGHMSAGQCIDHPRVTSFVPDA